MKKVFKILALGIFITLGSCSDNAISKEEIAKKNILERNNINSDDIILDIFLTSDATNWIDLNYDDIKVRWQELHTVDEEQGFTNILWMASDLGIQPYAGNMQHVGNNVHNVYNANWWLNASEELIRNTINDAIQKIVAKAKSTGHNSPCSPFVGPGCDTDRYYPRKKNFIDWVSFEPNDQELIRVKDITLNKITMVFKVDPRESFDFYYHSLLNNGTLEPIARYYAEGFHNYYSINQNMEVLGEFKDLLVNEYGYSENFHIKKGEYFIERNEEFPNGKIVIDIIQE